LQMLTKIMVETIILILEFLSRAIKTNEKGNFGSLFYI